MTKSLLSTVVVLSVAVALDAQVNPDLFNRLKWRCIGPFRGGRAVAVSGVPGGGVTFYFGAVNGGVWKTENGGSTWVPLFDAQPVASIGALAVTPSDPNVIYAGTGESDIRSDLASGDGVYKSSDGGKTWQNCGLKETRQISRIVVDPADANRVFVAALGHAYGPNTERGIFRSTDGGQTWQKVLYKDAQTGAADLSLAPDEPKLLFAALWEAHRPPWTTYAPLAGSNSGLYRSSDGGNTWRQVIGNGFPEGSLGRIGVAIAPGTHGKRIYAVIEADAKRAGLYRSDDGGDSWTRVNSDPRVSSRGWYFNHITADPNDPDVVYNPNVAFYKLSEGGKTLSIVRGAPGGDDYHQVWIDPANSSHMVLGTDQGTTVSLDGGKTWSTWYNQPTAQFYHVITDNDFYYHVYGAQQDSGTAATASRTDHGQIDLRDWFTIGGSESGYIAPNPKDPNIFYISGTYGELARMDGRMLQSQNIRPSPMPGNFASEINERKYRSPWTPVLIFSPIQPNALYFGAQYVMKTLDGGLHWETISPDLTGAKSHADTKPRKDLTLEERIEHGFGVVYTIAPSPLQASEIWAGSDTGLVHVTRDGGKTWSDVTPPGLGAWSKISLIEASHFASGTVYAAVDRHRLDDQRPYLFRTRDGGKTWQPIVTGIAQNAFINAVREDPQKKGLLFAGTEFGVYVSFNDGDQWTPLQLNLPVTSVRDLLIHGDDLLIATHGRSFWILDDIAPLRQIDATAASADRLFAPARAFRISSDRFTSTPMPPDEPQAENPARGAYIDYYLRAETQGPVLLDILDGQGKAVRHFSSTDAPPKTPENVPIAPRWFPKPPTLSGEPGMHRFVWDLRYGRSGENTVEDDDSDGESWVGPLVLPGLYRAKLTVNGQSFTEPLRVSMDPRSPATPAVLTVQFQWAQRAFDDMVDARKAILQLQSLETRLSKASQQLDPAKRDTAVAIASAQKHVVVILSQEGGAADLSLQEASRALTAALNGIESADRTPPSQLIALYQQASAAAKARLAEWATFEQQTLPALNRQLEAAGIARIQVSELEHEAAASLAK